MAGDIGVSGLSGFYPVILKITRDGDIVKAVKTKNKRSIGGFEYYGDKYYNIFARDREAYEDGDSSKSEYKFFDFAYTSDDGIVSPLHPNRIGPRPAENRRSRS